MPINWFSLGPWMHKSMLQIDRETDNLLGLVVGDAIMNKNFGNFKSNKIYINLLKYIEYL